MRVSSKTKDGLDQFWEEVENFRSKTRENFEQKRINQKLAWTWTHIKEGFEELMFANPSLGSKVKRLLEDVKSGVTTPGAASDEILRSIRLKLEAPELNGDIQSRSSR